MAFVLPIFTLLVWATRIRNIVADEWTLPELVVPVGLTVLALAALVRRRPWLPVLAGATVAVWVVRVPLVLLRDHAVGFKVVHVVLAAVSIALAYAAWRSVTRSAAESASRA